MPRRGPHGPGTITPLGWQRAQDLIAGRALRPQPGGIFRHRLADADLQLRTAGCGQRAVAQLQQMRRRLLGEPARARCDNVLSAEVRVGPVAVPHHFWCARSRRLTTRRISINIAAGRPRRRFSPRRVTTEACPLTAPVNTSTLDVTYGQRRDKGGPMRRRVLSLVGLAIAAPLALVATGIPSASAQPSMTITVGKPTVTARILVTVPVTIVCASLPDPNTAEDDVSVSIEQASGRTTVSTGSGSVDGGPFSPSGGQPFLTCDGSTQNIVVVKVLPDSGSGPFHTGLAIFTINARHVSGSCMPSCQETGSESARFGPASVRMRKG